MRKAIYLALRRSCMCAAMRTKIEFAGLEGVAVSFDSEMHVARLYLSLPTGVVREFELAGESDEEVAANAEEILGLSGEPPCGSVG